MGRVISVGLNPTPQSPSVTYGKAGSDKRTSRDALRAYVSRSSCSCHLRLPRVPPSRRYSTIAPSSPHRLLPGPVLVLGDGMAEAEASGGNAAWRCQTSRDERNKARPKPQNHTAFMAAHEVRCAFAKLRARCIASRLLCCGGRRSASPWLESLDSSFWLPCSGRGGSASPRFKSLSSSFWDTDNSMDGENATAWSGGGESRQLESVTFGYARVKGLRNHPIEDYHVARMQSFDGNEIGLFAVYDGHAGTEVASYLEQELFNKILAHPNFKSDPKRTITEIYFSEDKRILNKAEIEKGFRAGSTATTAFLLDKGHRLIVANVGDSRAVLASGGKAIEVSVDHEPQKPEEREMVESKGGEVSISPMGGVYRVDKRLNMSRAFGDYIIKEHLSVEPDIWDNTLTDQDDFLIVASDGLWKVMNNDEAVEHVLAQETAEGAAKVLAAAALRRGSRDDISVLVVCLKDLKSLSLKN